MPDRFDRELADAMPHVLWTHDRDGNAMYFNRAWVELTGLDLEETRRVGAASVVHPDDRDAVVRLFAESRERGEGLRATYRLRAKDGSYRWHEASVAPLRRDGVDVALWVGIARDVDDQHRLLTEARFVAEAARLLASSLDVQQTLANVARLAVPHLADGCAIDLLKEDAVVERVAVAHVDPAKVELAWDLWRKAPPAPDAAHGLRRVIRTRTPEHVEDLTDETLAALVRDPELLTILRGLGLRSSMCVPLIARERSLGALTLVSAESGRRYKVRDLEFAQDFAPRISTAIDNARLYAEATQARTAAEALAADVVEQSRAAERALKAMRAEHEAALARLAELERSA